MAVIFFIFSNSAESGPESNAKSGAVAQFLAPLLNPFGRMDDAAFHKLVRKLAHFVEFAALGFSLGGFACSMGLKRRGLCLASAAGALAVAIADETVQHFTGRTDSWKDVLLDFSGAVCGIAVMCLAIWLLGQLQTRKRGKNHG